MKYSFLLLIVNSKKKKKKNENLPVNIELAIKPHGKYLTPGCSPFLTGSQLLLKSSKTLFSPRSWEES